MNKNISHFHYLTQNLPEFTHEQLAEMACLGGSDWVQLRIKERSYDEFLTIALNTKEVCKKYNAKLIINDNVDIAFEVKADGVHLGKNDMNPVLARRHLGNNFIIGATCNTFEDIVEVVNAGADYVGVGPYKFTNTKKNLSPVLGLKGYLDIIEKCKSRNISIPVIAIGGIVMDDVQPLLETGIHGIAVSSAVNLELDKIQAARTFIETIKFKNNELVKDR